MLECRPLTSLVSSVNPANIFRPPDSVKMRSMTNIISLFCSLSGKPSPQDFATVPPPNSNTPCKLRATALPCTYSIDAVFSSFRWQWRLIHPTIFWWNSPVSNLCSRNSPDSNLCSGNSPDSYLCSWNSHHSHNPDLTAIRLRPEQSFPRHMQVSHLTSSVLLTIYKISLKPSERCILTIITVCKHRNHILWDQNSRTFFPWLSYVVYPLD